MKGQRRLLAGLWLRLRGHRDVPPGATALARGRDERVTGTAVLVAGLVELVAVHLLLPWPTVRLVLLVVSAYGCVLLLALLADSVVRPHVLADGELRLRGLGGLDVRVPLTAVVSAAPRRADASSWLALEGEVLLLGSGGQTQVEVVLAQPVTLRAGRVEGAVRCVRFAVDDPAAAVAALRARSAAR